MTSFALEARDICVSYPGVKALDHVDFDVRAGEIHALVGANGAGKSTLMNVLAGINPAYTGGIYINGSLVDVRSPAAAKRLGIQIVHQEVDAALAPTLSVAENILLDDLSGQSGMGPWMRWRDARKEAAALLDRLNMNFDVRERVGRLPLAYKQMVLIARALNSRCRVLLLDEPTAPLSSAETRTLFRLCRSLAGEQGLAIVFISHRLTEILQICGRYTALRNGKLAANAPITEKTSADELVREMLGEELSKAKLSRPEPSGAELLTVSGLSSRDGSVKDVSFTLNRGEVVGIAGLVGAGKSELCKAVFGALPVSAGGVRLAGRPARLKSPAAAVRRKMGLVPEERRKEGLFLTESLAFNMGAANLKKLSRMGFVRRKKLNENARTFVRHLGIKALDVRQGVGQLSGGNQQKAVVGKWLAAGCQAYLLDEPTKGIDVGAKGELLKAVNQLALSGCGVLYASSENGELLSITDRIYVMYGGRIVKELITAQTSQEEIMHYAVGERGPFRPAPPKGNGERT